MKKTILNSKPNQPMQNQPSVIPPVSDEIGLPTTFIPTQDDVRDELTQLEAWRMETRESMGDSF